MTPTLVILAAGLARRFGRLKQLEPLGPHGETLMDLAMHDAVRAGFTRVVLVVRREIREAVERHVRGRADAPREIAFVDQDVSDVPRGAQVPAGRVKPWGTAHAVLAAAPAVRGRFAVCNADDFYGLPAYRALMTHARQAAAGECAVVGYPVGGTLSAAGGVSRAVCRTDATGALVGLEEVTDIGARGTAITGRGADGVARPLAPDTLVSMNLWGFDEPVFDLLGQRFRAFLARRGGDPEAEFLLPDAVHDLVVAGVVRVRVLRAVSTWMGITHAADAAEVSARLAGGAYDATLNSGDACN